MDVFGILRVWEDMVCVDRVSGNIDEVWGVWWSLVGIGGSDIIMN